MPRGSQRFHRWPRLQTLKPMKVGLVWKMQKSIIIKKMYGKVLVISLLLIPYTTRVKDSSLSLKIFSTEKLTEDYLMYTSPALGRGSASPTHH